MSLLEVQDLSISYVSRERRHVVVDRLSFSIAPGESVGLVGESGSGKTQTALAIMGLLPASASVSGEIRFDGTALLGADAHSLNRFRPRRVAMVFQDSLAAMNPYVRVGEQLRRIIIEHKICAAGAAKQRCIAMLEKVGLADPERQYRAYPHELSGGMRQRVMLGAALLGDPDLLVADEPTTALDVTVQAQVLNLLREVRQQSNTALLLITHDLGVVAGQCKRTLVMDKGALLEDGLTQAIFSAPVSEKMQELLAVAPRISRESAIAPLHNANETVLEVEGLNVSFAERRRRGPQRLAAVRDLSLALQQGETVAIVGESGSGKTSLARAIVGLLPVASGRVAFLGKPLASRATERARATHAELQMVFQDPLASLNPAMRVAKIIAEPLRVHAGRGTNGSANIAQTVTATLARVGLHEEYLQRYPHQLSGGQAQRVAIARALILEPRVLICDEAVAALDGTVQQEILSLLHAEQQRTGLGLLFITHDLAVVRQISHRIVVMYMGRVCEVADNATLFRRPRHPYTRALINAVPEPDPAFCPPAPLPGEPASILHPPAGCPFHPRCASSIEICTGTVPKIQQVGAGSVACHRAVELDLSENR